ncbi:MAG: GNAT family N-acetyltransferase [Mojavia pulchra JT2-VF2]|jgi:RimJ/RimL family protein N-acetyltransferase|uniref:GNAT family N-acetyltransferase n=1 Tax=Mojavia pulchra JT2-VF2 TaxID=287848 RepID=A0A951Q4F6_9NOST|nr:GNAT family N-acetyltransferase [Mojavia pulchra JT2-VF2]
MIIRLLKNSFSLSNLQATDAIAYVEHLNDPMIHKTTENIPYPYTKEHALHWIQRHTDITNQYGKPHVLAIRNPQAQLIGSIGIGEMDGRHPHVAELGYWLASSYWGQGIMTRAVKVFIDYAFTELGLLRLWTRVFEFNLRSRRVLEKNGFLLEGIQRQHLYRDGKLIDDYLYGLLKADLNRAA